MEKSEISVEIPVELTSNIIVANIIIVQNNPSIVAFAQIDFGFLTIKGITIKKVDFNGDGNEVLVFDLPGYKTKYRYVKSVYISDKNLFFEISKAIIAKVNEQLGNSQILSDEFVDPDDIPF